MPVVEPSEPVRAQGEASARNLVAWLVANPTALLPQGDVAQLMTIASIASFLAQSTSIPLLVTEEDGSSWHASLPTPAHRRAALQRLHMIATQFVAGLEAAASVVAKPISQYLHQDLEFQVGFAAVGSWDRAAGQYVRYARHITREGTEAACRADAGSRLHLLINLAPANTTNSSFSLDAGRKHTGSRDRSRSRTRSRTPPPPPHRRYPRACSPARSGLDYQSLRALRDGGRDLDRSRGKDRRVEEDRGGNPASAPKAARLRK